MNRLHGLKRTHHSLTFFFFVPESYFVYCTRHWWVTLTLWPKMIKDGISGCLGGTGEEPIACAGWIGFPFAPTLSPQCRNRPKPLSRLMVTSPGQRPVQSLPLALPWQGYHYPQCVTSDSLGQALKQSILHNLENQPSLQKQRGNIGNKDGYIIWHQAPLHPTPQTPLMPSELFAVRKGGGYSAELWKVWDKGWGSPGQIAQMKVQITRSDF